MTKWSPMSSNQPMAGPLLRLDDVGLAYHSRRGIQAMLQHISFSLAQGEHLTVSGPSGCGKSTLLRLIAGLQAPTEGQIYFAGQKMTAPRPDLAIVFQDYGLFPWKTVEENILLPGRLHGSPLDKDQLASLLDTLGLTAVRHHYPGELSGGQKQRTALGRAMVCDTHPSQIFRPAPGANRPGRAGHGAIRPALATDPHDTGGSCGDGSKTKTDS